MLPVILANRVHTGSREARHTLHINILVGDWCDMECIRNRGQPSTVGSHALAAIRQEHQLLVGPVALVAQHPDHSLARVVVIERIKNLGQAVPGGAADLGAERYLACANDQPARWLPSECDGLR